MAETTDNKDKDLLGFSRDKMDVGNPAQYLKLEDFITQPKTTDEEYYPTRNQSVEGGQTPSKYFGGGIPVYSGSGSLPPYALVDARANAIQHAAIADQMRKSYADNQKIDVAYNRPHDLPLSYNEDFQNVGKNTAMQMYGDAVKYYGGNQSKASQDLINPNGVFGKKYADFNQNYHTYAANIDEMSSIAQNIRKSQQENKIIVPPEMEKTLSDFEEGGFGKLDEHDPHQLKQQFMKLKIMNNMLPQYNNFVNRIQKSELPNEPVGRYKAKPGYITSAVDPVAAKEEAVKTINSGGKSAWAFIAGLKPDATVDEIAEKLSKDAVNQHGVQYKPLPEHPDHKGAGWGNGEFTNDRFAVRPDAKYATGELKPGSGYQIQDLTANENSFKEVWQAPYALDAKNHVKDSKFTGEVAGAVTGVELARNPNTDKLEWFAVITEPAVTNTDKNTTITGDYNNKNVKSAAQASVTAPATHLIPYDDKVSAKIEAYTADKKGTGGFKLQKADFDRVNELNGYLDKVKQGAGSAEQKVSHPLPSGKPASVKQNGVVYTWNSQSGKYE